MRKRLLLFISDKCTTVEDVKFTTVEDVICKILYLKNKVEEFRIGVEDCGIYEMAKGLANKRNDLKAEKDRFKELTGLDYDSFVVKRVL